MGNPCGLFPTISSQVTTTSSAAVSRGERERYRETWRVYGQKPRDHGHRLLRSLAAAPEKRSSIHRPCELFRRQERRQSRCRPLRARRQVPCDIGRHSNSPFTASRLKKTVLVPRPRPLRAGIQAALDPAGDPLSPGDFIGKWIEHADTGGRPRRRFEQRRELMTHSERQTALGRYFSIRHSIAQPAQLPRRSPRSRPTGALQLCGALVRHPVGANCGSSGSRVRGISNVPNPTSSARAPPPHLPLLTTDPTFQARRDKKGARRVMSPVLRQCPSACRVPAQSFGLPPRAIRPPGSNDRG